MKEIETLEEHIARQNNIDPRRATQQITNSESTPTESPRLSRLGSEEEKAIDFAAENNITYERILQNVPVELHIYIPQ